MADVPLRSAEDTDGKVAVALAGLESLELALPILRAVANAESAFPSFLRYARSLMNELSLPPRTRELVIMRCAVRQGSRYEWAEHYTMALNAGVTREELDLLEAGEVPGTLAQPELDCLTAADAIVDWMVDGEEPRGLVPARERLGPRAFSELALVLGWWAGCVPIVARILNLDPDRPAIPAPAP